MQEINLFALIPAKCQVKGKAPTGGLRLWYGANWSGLLYISGAV